MQCHCGVDVSAIAAGHRHGHRHLLALQKVKHSAVSLGQARSAETEPTQPVVLVRIGARQVERQARWAASGTLPVGASR